MSFSSPEAALDAVAVCLADLSERPIHVGSLNSGLTLDCCCDDCEGPLIRVESNNTAAKEGEASLYMLSKNRCRDMVIEIVVVYAVCFTSYDGEGPAAVPIEEATKQGRANVQSWWGALGILADCGPANQSLRFRSAQDDQPEGGCFGWTMRLAADVSLCR